MALIVILLLCVAALRLAANAPANQTHTSEQQAQVTRPQTIPAGLRPLNVKEGRAIVRGIMRSNDEGRRAPDCSHLVHKLYEQVGYPYPYASSLDLYRGTAQFARMRAPQPGDLIVWPGHVGIVVSPRQHSFFSSVTSGTQIENYTSGYWRARGQPRFYRYLTSRAPKNGGDRGL